MNINSKLLFTKFFPVLWHSNLERISHFHSKDQLSSQLNNLIVTSSPSLLGLVRVNRTLSGSYYLIFNLNLPTLFKTKRFRKNFNRSFSKTNPSNPLIQFNLFNRLVTNFNPNNISSVRIINLRSLPLDPSLIGQSIIMNHLLNRIPLERQVRKIASLLNSSLTQNFNWLVHRRYWLRTNWLPFFELLAFASTNLIYHFPNLKLNPTKFSSNKPISLFNLSQHQLTNPNPASSNSPSIWASNIFISKKEILYPTLLTYNQIKKKKKFNLKTFVKKKIKKTVLKPTNTTFVRKLRKNSIMISRNFPVYFNPETTLKGKKINKINSLNWWIFERKKNLHSPLKFPRSTNLNLPLSISQFTFPHSSTFKSKPRIIAYLNACQSLSRKVKFKFIGNKKYWPLLKNFYPNYSSTIPKSFEEPKTYSIFVRPYLKATPNHYAKLGFLNRFTRPLIYFLFSLTPSFRTLIGHLILELPSLGLNSKLNNHFIFQQILGFGLEFRSLIAVRTQSLNGYFIKLKGPLSRKVSRTKKLTKERGGVFPNSVSARTNFIKLQTKTKLGIIGITVHL